MNERIYDIDAREAVKVAIRRQQFAHSLDLCRGRSSSPTLVCKVTNLVPIGISQFRNQSLTFECYLAEPKWARAFPLSDDLA
jgi:hypothetical protein